MEFNLNCSNERIIDKLILIWESNRHRESDDQLFILRYEMEKMRVESLSNITNNSKNIHSENI